MNVLLVRAGALGDLLLLRRAIFGLKRRGYRVALMAPNVGRALRGPGASEVDEILDWDDPAFVPLHAPDVSPSPGLAERLGAFSACIAYTSQTPLVASLESFIGTVIAHPPVPAGVHAAEWLARPTLRLGAETSALPPDMQATAAEEAEADQFLLGQLSPGFCAIHPGSGSATKNWPGERFARLARYWSPGPWLLIEGPADAFTVASFTGRGWLHARHLPLRTLGAVVRRAGLFVGNDSGVTHLAAAWGAPTLALFGPTDPATWSPVGRCVVVARSPTATLNDLSVRVALRAAHPMRGAPADLG